MEDVTMQKKSILIAMFWVLAAVLLPVSTTSFAATIVPAGQSSYSTAPLYGTYPFVGSDEDSNYYLDPSSTYFSNRESSVPALGGLVYKVQKGSGDVAISQLDPYNVTFSTYTGNSERYISVDRVMHNGVNVRQEMTENNQAFFDSLFWKVADITGATEYWRTHVNN